MLIPPDPIFVSFNDSSLERRIELLIAFLRSNWLLSVPLLNLNDIESNFLIPDSKGETWVSVLWMRLDYVKVVEIIYVGWILVSQELSELSSAM